MANIFTVVYPHEAGASFDEKYYVDQHMPLVSRTWGPSGLESWSVTTHHPGPDGTDPTYRVSCELIFRDEKSLQESLKSPEFVKIVEDVPKFTTIKPVFHYGKKIAASSG